MLCILTILTRMTVMISIQNRTIKSNHIKLVRIFIEFLQLCAQIGLSQTTSTKLLPVEDAYTTGFCAKKIGSHPPVNDPRFSCGQLVEKDCDMAKLFTGHKVTPERMWIIYQKLQKGIC